MPWVTMIGTLPPTQGISSYCRELVSELQKRASLEFIDFSAFAPRFIYHGKQGGRDELFDAQEWKNVEVRKMLAWYNPFSWIHAGLSLRGEVLHVQWWSYLVFPCLFSIALLAKLRGKKIICTVHNVFSHETNGADRFFSRIFFGVCDHFIVHSERNRENFQRHYSVSPARVHVIPHGIIGFYRDKSATRKNSRERLGIPSKEKVVLFFGNVRPYKGVEDILEAHQAAREKVKGLRLFIVGNPWTPAYGKAIQAMAAGKEGVTLHLSFIPSGEVKYYFEAADVVVLPYRDFSSQSGVGNVALAFHQPLLVSDVGALPDLVADARAVFPSGNVSELAERIIAFFSNPAWVRALKEGSRKKCAEFEWNAISEATHEVYIQMLREKDGSEDD